MQARLCASYSLSMILRRASIFLAFAVLAAGVVRADSRQSSLADIQHAACENRRAMGIENNKRVLAIDYLQKFALEFTEETRRARADKGGTSYDVHFVHVIDTLVPYLKLIEPQPVKVPQDC